MKEKAAQAIATLTINGVVREAECSLCHEYLGLVHEIGSPEAQRARIEEAFDRHMTFRHPTFHKNLHSHHWTVTQ